MTNEDVYKDIKRLSSECLQNTLYNLIEEKPDKHVLNCMLSNIRLNAVKRAAMYYYINIYSISKKSVDIL